jgi:Tripartite tricarboxylate transporter family receptor
MRFASGGHATTNHLADELFKSLAGVDMLHVPYKSAAEFSETRSYTGGCRETCSFPESRKR